MNQTALNCMAHMGMNLSRKRSGWFQFLGLRAGFDGLPFVPRQGGGA